MGNDVSPGDINVNDFEVHWLEWRMDSKKQSWLNVTFGWHDKSTQMGYKLRGCYEMREDTPDNAKKDTGDTTSDDTKSKKEKDKEKNKETHLIEQISSNDARKVEFAEEEDVKEPSKNYIWIYNNHKETEDDDLHSVCNVLEEQETEKRMKFIDFHHECLKYNSNDETKRKAFAQEMYGMVSHKKLSEPECGIHSKKHRPVYSSPPIAPEDLSIRSLADVVIRFRSPNAPRKSRKFSKKLEKIESHDVLADPKVQLKKVQSVLNVTINSKRDFM